MNTAAALYAWSTDLLADIWFRLAITSTSERIALTALVVAGFSAWQSWRSRQVSERAFAFARDKSDHRLDLYLVEAYIRPVPAPARRVFVFRLRVTNASDVANGLTSLTLRVDFTAHDGVPRNVIALHDPSIAGHAGGIPSDVIVVPGGIAARAVIGGAGLFVVSDDLLRGARVESYTVFLVDSYGVSVQQEAILLREVRDEVVEMASGRSAAETSG